jgi:hypothetical protein
MERITSFQNQQVIRIDLQVRSVIIGHSAALEATRFTVR